MKDLLLGVQVVVKTLNLEISRCRLAKSSTTVRAARAARLFFLIYRIKSLFPGVVVAVAVVVALISFSIQTALSAYYNSLGTTVSYKRHCFSKTINPQGHYTAASRHITYFPFSSQSHMLRKLDNRRQSWQATVSKHWNM